MYSKEQIEFIKNNINGKTSYEIIEMFNNEFNILLTYQQLKHIKRKYNLKSNVNSRFKKNDIPHNKRQLYDEFVSTDGYTYVKIKEPNTWVLKQKYIYEKYIGKIPKNKSVIFLNGNKEDFELSNLLLVDDCDKLVAKNLHLFSSESEITKTGLTLAKLINKTSKLNKERN